MKMSMRKVLSVLLIFAICCTSCKKVDVNQIESDFTRDGHYGYDTQVINFGESPDCSKVLKGSFYDGEKYYISMDWYEMSGDNSYSILYSLDTDGVLGDGVTLSNNEGLFSDYQTKLGDNWVVRAGYKTLIFYDIESGEEIRRLNFDINILFALEYKDEYILISENKLYLCNQDGNILSEIDLSSINYMEITSPCFVNQDDVYVIGKDNANYKVYKVNFDTRNLDLFYTVDGLGEGYIEYTGEYFINSVGEYKISINDQQLMLMADWNSINDYPGSKVVVNSTYCSGDDESFIKINENVDNDIEVNLYTYNYDIDYSNAIRITVGGYGISSDLSLLRAQYLYNTTHSDYRIFMDDYNNLFGIGNYSEGMASSVDLIQYFNEGNTPDIFYGYYFDYDYFYDNDITQDIRPYIEADGFDLSSISTNIRDIWSREDGSIYMIFSSYYLNGNVAKRGMFSDDNVSYTELIQMAEQTGIVPVDYLMTADVADSIIRYGLRDIYRNRTGDHVIGLDDMQAIVDFSINHGNPYNSYDIYMGSAYDLAYDNQLMTMALSTDLQSYIDYCRMYDCEFSYIGHPSINRSYHVINTNGQMAMSSNTEYGEECWRFMELLLSDDFQKSEIIQYCIPVNLNVMEEFYAIAINPELDISGMFSTILDYEHPATEFEIQSYREFIGSVDTIVSYDWGVYDIICDEIYSYDLQGRSTEVIADSLQTRLDLYVEENY